LFQFSEELTAANVDDHCETWKRGLSLGEKVGHWAEHLRRKVVDHIPTEVF
jgi:hypothetical protein